jgi:phage gp36-like protein
MAEFIPIPASDTYSADEDVYNAYGADSVRAWADLNSNGDADEITARMAWGRGSAYREMHDAMRAAGLTVPATAENFRGFASLPDIEAQVAGFWLHRSRGVNNQQTSGLNADEIEDNYKRAMARLAGLIKEQVDLDDDDSTASAGTFQSVRINRGRCRGDEYSGWCN